MTYSQMIESYYLLEWIYLREDLTLVNSLFKNKVCVNRPGCVELWQQAAQVCSVRHFPLVGFKSPHPPCVPLVPISLQPFGYNPILLTGLEFNWTMRNFLCTLHWFLIDSNVITAHQRCCGKIMFSVLCICHFVCPQGYPHTVCQ